jgi:transposase
MWIKLKPVILNQGIYNKSTLRNTIEGILYRMRVGCPWRDLPDQFGRWNTIYKCFNHWSFKGKFLEIFKNLIVDPDLEWEFIDGSIVKAHQHSMGAQKHEEAAIGKSKGGNTTKIHLAVDSSGNPIEFTITEGQVHDSKEAKVLLDLLPQSDFTIADKGYDSNDIRVQIELNGSKPIIPRKSNSKIGNDDIDRHLYKYRHLVENVFAKFKVHRAISTRYDKLKRNFENLIALACALIWLPL